MRNSNSDNSDAWVELFVTYDEIEAEIVKDLLEGENIEVVVRSSKITPYPVNIGKMGEVRLLVRNDNAERARDILKAMEDSSQQESHD